MDHIDPLTADPTISYDLSCRRCGYNLRGQQPAGACPECGAPVADAYIADRLCDADPAWLGALSRGARWIVIGIFAAIALSFVNMVLSFAMMDMAAIQNQPPSPGLSYNPQVYPPWLMLVFSVEGVAFSILFIWATWQITQPQPDALTAPPARLTTRWTIVGAYAVTLLAVPTSFIHTPPVLYITMGLQVLSMLLLSVGVPASLLYLRSLARRIPDPGLTRQTTIVFWGNIIAGGVLIAGLLVVLVVTLMAVGNNTSTANPQQLAMAMSLASLATCPGLLAIVVFMIWWVVLMCLYNGALGRVYRQALHNAA